MDYNDSNKNLDKKFNNVINELQNIGDKIYFLGTMHLSGKSADYVKNIIDKLDFNCVMIELDEFRYKELKIKEKNRNKLKNSKEIKKKSKKESKKESEITDEIDSEITDETESDSFFDALQNFQQEIGKTLGIMPGIEMLSAVNAANLKKIPVKFIDQPILITFQRLQELQNEVKDEQSDLLKNLDEQIEKFDIQEMVKELQKPGIITEIIREFKKNYPQLSNILLNERNEYMAERILDYFIENPSEKILIVLGAGHVEELISLIIANI